MKHKSRFLLPILTFLTFGMVTGSVVVNKTSQVDVPIEKADAGSATTKAIDVYLKAPNWSGTLNYFNAQYHNASTGTWAWCYPSHPETIDSEFRYDSTVNVYKFNIPSGTDKFQFKLTQSSADKYTVEIETSTISVDYPGYEYGSYDEWKGQFRVNTWTVYPYTINYNSNGGTGTVGPDHAYEHCDWGVATNSFTRTGYTFQKWCNSATGEGDVWVDEGGKYNRQSNSTTALTLYAIWIPDTIRFVWNNKSTNNYIYLWNETDYGSKKENHAWPGEAATGSFTANSVTYYYYDFSYSTKDWVPNKVIFTDSTGSSSVKTGDLTVPVKAWDGSYYYSLSSATATSATMTKSVYKVVKGTQTNGSLTVAAYGTHGTSLSISWAPEGTAGYTYSSPIVRVKDENSSTLATYTSGTSASFTMPGKFSRQITITLSYTKTANKYTVVFDKQSGDGGSDNVKATFNSDMPSATMPSRTGYTFGGYYASTGGNGTQYYSSEGSSSHVWDVPTDNTCIYAKWTANPFTIKYNANGGTGDSFTQDATYDTGLTLEANSFSRTGYTFYKWNTQADGNGTDYSASEVLDASKLNGLYPGTSGGTKNLYAKWTANQYNVTYANGGHGTAPSSTKATYNASFTPASAITGVTGYTFNNWSGSDSKTYTAGSATTFTTADDVTLTATWNIVNYTIGYTLNGGSVAVDNPTSYTIESDTFTLNNPTKSSNIFLGWSGTGIDSPSYSKSVTISNGSNGNRTYTAHWIEKSFISGDQFGFKFTIPGEMADDYDNVLVHYPDPTKITGEEIDYVPTLTTVGGNKVFVVPVNASQMSANINVYIKKGETIISSFTETIKGAVENSIGEGSGNFDPETCSDTNILKAAVSYGAFAQTYFSESITQDSLPNYAMTSADKQRVRTAMETVEIEELTKSTSKSETAPAFSFTGASFSCSDGFVIRITLNLKGTEASKYKVELVGEKSSEGDYSELATKQRTKRTLEYNEDVGAYCVYVRNIAPEYINTPVTIKITDKDTNNYRTVTYSVGMYLYYTTNNSTNTALLDLCKSVNLLRAVATADPAE